MFTPIPGNKIQVVSEHILYNFLPGWFNFNHQLLKTVALWRRVRTCGVFPKPTKVEGKLTFLRTEFGSLHLGRFFRKKKKNIAKLRMANFVGEFSWDFSDRGICYGKKGGQPWFLPWFQFHVLRFQFVFFFFYEVCLRVKGKHWWQGKKVATNILYFSAAVPSDEHS